MTKTIDILGIGNAIMDVIAPVDDTFLKVEKIERNAMSLIDEKRAVKLTESFCLLYTSPSPRDQRGSRMPSSA